MDHYLPVTEMWSKLRGVSDYGWQNLHLHALGAAMVRDAETGEIKWNLIIGGVLTAAILGVAGQVISNGTLVAAIGARQELVLQRLTAIEQNIHPATSKRYTSDDAAHDREIVEKHLTRIEERITRIEDRITRIEGTVVSLRK